MIIISAVDSIKLTGILIDVAAVLLVLIFGLIGAKAGFVRMVKGLVACLVAIAIAITFMKPILTKVRASTEIESDIATALMPQISQIAEIDSDITLRYIDGQLMYADANGDYVAIKELTGKNFFNVRYIVIFLVERSAIKQLTENPTTTENLLRFISKTFAEWILVAGLFLALVIVFSIIMKILLLILKKIASVFYIAHFLNGVLGFVFLGAVVFLVIYAGLGVVKYFENESMMDPVKSGIESTTILKLFYNAENKVYAFLLTLKK
ncbi:MAG: hypothetical protein LBE09_08520 [Christensenellaceae bacterium]|jgi:uncharacterized membrane protein required for colicin V production|nr:hypothetical protein [Christensenellaceae bacterium]